MNIYELSLLLLAAGVGLWKIAYFRGEKQGKETQHAQEIDSLCGRAEQEFDVDDSAGNKWHISLKATLVITDDGFIQ